MAFLKFLLVLLLIIPLGAFMLYLLTRLADDIPKGRKKEQRESHEEAARRRKAEREALSRAPEYPRFNASSGFPEYPRDPFEKNDPFKHR